MAVAAAVASQLGDLPIAGMITSLAQGIAQAQLELDETSMQIARMMAGTEEEDRVVFGSKTYSLLELGLAPTFYHFTDTTLEVKMSISLTMRGEGSFRHLVNTVDASFSNKYQYSVEGSGRIRTRMASLPPPPIFQERVRELMAGERAYREALGGS